MAFTAVTITGTWPEPTNTGTVMFTPVQSMNNDGEPFPAAPTVVTLSDGSISVPYVSTQDPGTVPQGVWIGVTEQIDGAQPWDYFITIPVTDEPVDLSVLRPGLTAWR